MPYWAGSEYNISVTDIRKNITALSIGIIMGIAFAMAFAVPVCAGTPKSDEVYLEKCTIAGQKEFTVGAERGIVDYVEISGRTLDYHSNHHPELYLFELKAYQDNISECETYTARIGRDEAIDLRLRLNADTEDTRLFSGFVLARKYGGEYYPVSNRIYVTNPEYIASSNIAYGDPSSKKGLLVDFYMTDDAMELGVKRVIVNIDFAMLMGEGICYEYNGHEYEFSEGLVAEYDRVISTYSGKEMQVTAVVLNALNENTPELHYDQLSFEDDIGKIPKNAMPRYYHFNTNTQEGMETTAALASFLAERYSGEDRAHGRVSNWIIGNEINNPDRWNYMGEKDFDSYMREYARSFRVFYNAMKAKSANTKLFFSIDYDWVYSIGSGPDVKYGGKAVVDTLNTLFRQGGNIDWNLAYHPYSSPMTEPEFWDDSRVTESEDSPIINFKNLHVLTDYLTKGRFLNTKGAVRDIILSEEGFTSRSATRGECQELQAAAFAYAYYIADNNEYIDAFLLSRQLDAPLEMKDGLYFGLWSCDENGQPYEKKYIWEVFRDIDNKDITLEATAFAKPIIGITRWSDVIPGFKYNEDDSEADTAQ